MSPRSTKTNSTLTSPPTQCSSESIKKQPPKLRKQKRPDWRLRRESSKPKKGRPQRKFHRRSNLRRTKKNHSTRRLKRPEMKKNLPA